MAARLPADIFPGSFLHLAFEAYYVVNRHDIAGMNTLFAQLWKEYTLSDSRYLTLDAFTVCVETITVVRASSSLPDPSPSFFFFLFLSRPFGCLS